jgi:predicted ATPase/class 3 adenylate cyclase
MAIAAAPQPHPAALPAGTVTLLLADVEGSTRLWEATPEQMSAALARLDAVVGPVVAKYGGVRPVEQGEGDSFVAAFEKASDALRCAIELQLTDLSPARLRMAMHTGEVAMRDEGNYMGPAVNRCARIRDLAYGGQTVMSSATHDLVVDRLPEGVWIADLGSRRLRDLTRPERIFQVCHPRLPTEFPALRSLDSYPHNLPVQLTSFVGRRAELEHLAGLLSETRLVSVIGAGGAGKTRLALQVAAEVLTDHPDGIWFVELSSATDDDLVPVTVARALGLRDEPLRSTIETIVHRLENSDALIVLDNCEHVISACAQLVETILRSCPNVQILLTSREPLGIGAEVTWRIPSLSLPDADDGLAEDSEAVQLFIERAARARPGFRLTDVNAASVAEICERLDGIPLALELAAARVRVFSPEQIAAGLADRFRLLTGGARTAVARQQTLQASVDWSHDLLSPAERTLFRRLSVFAGVFDFAAAAVIGAGPGLESHQVLDQLSLLVDKSLVVADDTADGLRYRMLETVRLYAFDRLVDFGEERAVRRRHRDHYLAFAEEAARRTRGPQQRRWLDVLVGATDNLRAAFRWSCQNNELDAALRIATALGDLFIWRGRFGEGREWLDAALEGNVAGAPEAPTPVRVRALALRGRVEGASFGFDVRWPEEAIALAREYGDKGLLAEALTAAGMTAAHMGGLANSWCAEAIELSREVGDSWSLSEALGAHGVALVLGGDPAAARAAFVEGYALGREVGHDWPARTNASLLALAMVMQGDLEAARHLCEDVVQEARDTGDRVSESSALAFQAWALTMLGELEAARAVGDEALSVAQSVGFNILEGLPRLVQSITALAGGNVDRAAAEAGEAWRLAGGLTGVVDVALAIRAEAELTLGDVEAARASISEGVERAAGGEWFRAWLMGSSATVALAEGDLDTAEAQVRTSLTARLNTRDIAGVADQLELAATIAHRRGHDAVAAQLFGAAATRRTEIGFVRFEIHRASYDDTVVAVRDKLGDEAFGAAWNAGAAMTFEDAVRRACLDWAR